MAIRPLAYFRDWATMPQDVTMYQQVRNLLNLYAERIQNVNFSDPKQWAEFVNKWQGAIKFVAHKHGYSREVLASPAVVARRV